MTNTALEDWGWDEGWERTWTESTGASLREAGPGDAPESGTTTLARVLVEHRNRWEVVASSGVRTATARPGGAGNLGARPAVGDWVAIADGGADDTAMIVGVLPRRMRLSRGAAGSDGRDSREQVVAANVDTVWIVHGLDAPINPRRIERYVTLCWESGASPVVVLAKTDLLPDLDEDPVRREAVERQVATAAVGVSVRLVSARNPETLSALEPDLTQGKTVALLGPSGAGKSSLINALLGTDALATGEVRPGDRKGRHTTTWRQLVRLDSGALLLDTPGMRELPLWETDEGLERAFAEISELAERCRFRDCAHDSEPGCAVNAAVEEGRLDPARLNSYRKLRAEAEWQRRRVDILAQQAETSRIKSAQKSLRAHLKRKGD